jgi:hypothetical protein
MYIRRLAFFLYAGQLHVSEYLTNMKRDDITELKWKHVGKKDLKLNPLRFGSLIIKFAFHRSRVRLVRRW